MTNYFWKKTPHYSKSQIFVQKLYFDKTPTFSRVFHPIKIDNFLGKSKLNFWTKNEDFEQCASEKCLLLSSKNSTNFFNKRTPSLAFLMGSWHFFGLFSHSWFFFSSWVELSAERRELKIPREKSPSFRYCSFVCATTPSIVIVKKQRHHPQNEDQFLELEVSQLSRQTSPARRRSSCSPLCCWNLEGLYAARNKASNHHIFNDKMSNYSWFLVHNFGFVKSKRYKIQH